MDSVTAWLAANGPTTHVVTHWRRMAIVNDDHRDSLRRWHRCDADGRPICMCGKRAAKAGNLEPEVVEMKRRPVNACEWWAANWQTRRTDADV